MFVYFGTSQVALVVKKLPANTGDILILGLGRSPEGGDGNPLLFLPGQSHRQRSLVGYSQWGCKEFDTTEYLSPQYVYLSLQ